MARGLTPSIRAQFTERRTYLRPLNENGTAFETPEQALDRVIGHQRWLWEKQLGRRLSNFEEVELGELRQLMVEKKVSASGRVKWMGGTDIIKERASAAFNCSFTTVKTPADLVDVFWLLLQGCGVGFKPIPGLLTGFPETIEEIIIVPSSRTERAAWKTMSPGSTWTPAPGPSSWVTARWPGQRLSASC